MIVVYNVCTVTVSVQVHICLYCVPLRTASLVLKKRFDTWYNKTNNNTTTEQNRKHTEKPKPRQNARRLPTVSSPTTARVSR